MNFFTVCHCSSDGRKCCPITANCINYMLNASMPASWREAKKPATSHHFNLWTGSPKVSYLFYIVITPVSITYLQHAWGVGGKKQCFVFIHSHFYIHSKTDCSHLSTNAGHIQYSRCSTNTEWRPSISECMQISCKLLISSCVEKSALVIRNVCGHEGIGDGILQSTALPLITDMNLKVLTYTLLLLSTSSLCESCDWRRPASTVCSMHQHTAAVWWVYTLTAAWRTFTSLYSIIRLDALCGQRP